MSKIKTIIFDFDGTIADSFEFMSIEFNNLSKRFGEKELSLYEVKVLKNDTFENLIGRYKLWKILLMAFLLQNRMSNNISSIKLHTGMREVVLDLHQKGYDLYIFSNNTTTIIKKFLKYYSIDHCFKVVVGRRNLSSKSRALAKFLSKHQLQPNQTIYIGDEVKDILAARDNGIQVISVNWGFNSSKILRKYNPDWLVSRSKRIISIVDNIKSS